MSVFEHYLVEIEKDLKIDELSMKDKALMIPAIKHKWAARLIQEKIKLKKLESSKKTALETLAAQLQAQSFVTFNKTVLAEAVAKSPQLKAINDDISESEVLIEYLEKVDRIMTGMGYDLKNLIDVIKMETM